LCTALTNPTLSLPAAAATKCHESVVIASSATPKKNSQAS